MLFLCCVFCGFAPSEREREMIILMLFFLYHDVGNLYLMMCVWSVLRESFSVFTTKSLQAFSEPKTHLTIIGDVVSRIFFKFYNCLCFL